MSRVIKFRAWHPSHKEMVVFDNEKASNDVYIARHLLILMANKSVEGKDLLMQFTGLTDKNEKEYYIGDIGQFDNGDKFVVCMEDWLEVYVKWIGEPECADQARDLYRIGRAIILGNIHQNEDLLND